MNEWVGVVALAVALVSVGIAFWQGNTSKAQLELSRKQLELAKDTEGRTERALEEIKRVTAETRQLSQDVKNNIDERITKILDSKLAAESQSQANGAKIGEMFMNQLAQRLGASEPKEKS